MKLLIDDIRDIEGVDYIARHGKAGLELLDLLGGIKTLYLDHDLGTDSISGYSVAMKALEMDIMPNEVILVTSNPVGRDNIIAALKQFGYTNKGSEVTTWKIKW